MPLSRTNYELPVSCLDCSSVDALQLDAETKTFSINSLGIIHINVCSCRANFDMFTAYLSSLQFKFSIIILTEIFAKSSTDIYSMDGYRSYNLYRDTRGGGIKIFVLDSISSSERVDLRHIDHVFESLTISINLPNLPSFFITAVYRCHTSSINEFNQKFPTELLNKLRPSDKCLFIGDFNIDLFNPRDEQCIEDFYTIMLNKNLLPAINCPTRIASNSATVIDHIWTNFTIPFHSYVIESHISDHFPIALILPTTNINDKVKVKFRNFSQSNVDKFVQEMPHLLQDYQRNIFDPIPAHNVTQFCAWLSSKIDSYFPVSSKDISLLKSNAPWINSELKKLIRKKHLLYRNYKSGSLSFDDFKIYRNLLNKLLKKSKQNYFRNAFSLARKNIKVMWKLINSAMGKSKGSQVPVISVDNNTLFNEESIAEAFNTFFTSIPNTLHSQIPRSLQNYDNLIPIQPNSAYFADSDDREVANIIAGLKNKNSSTDNITIKILKFIYCPISVIISYLFNKCLNAGVYPPVFKKAKVIPIYKKGSGSTLIINHYRPISILPTLNKIFEKLTYSRINNFLSANNTISQHQYGFRKNSSTQHATLNLISHIIPAFTLKHFSITVFIDFSKAFDTITHELLLNKLYRYGFRGLPYNLIKSYLSARSQYVLVGNSYSSELALSHGVPQGSCLGPLLFNIYTNDITYLPLVSHLIQYADDTTLTLTLPSLNEASNLINSDLERVVDWCAFNKLSVNVGKTKAILFTPCISDSYPEIKLGNVPVQYVPDYKYLGMIIDKDLKFRAQISSLSGKLARVVGISYSIGSLLNVPAALSVYFSLAYSHISYIISVWGNSGVTRIGEIQVQQNKIIRNLFQHHFPNLHTDELFARLELLKVSDIYRLELGKVMFKTINSDSYPFLNNMLVDLQWHHNQNTRKTCVYRLPRARILCDYNSFLFQGVKLWNSLPLSVRNSTSIYTFKKSAKFYLLSQSLLNI